MKRFAFVVVLCFVSAVAASAQSVVQSTENEKKITVDFATPAALDEVIYFIAKEEGYGVADLSVVQGHTYMGYLPVVSMDQALTSILAPKGFRYEIKNKIIYIYPGSTPLHRGNAPPQTIGSGVIGSGPSAYQRYAGSGGVIGSGMGGGWYGQEFYYEQLHKRMERQFHAENEWGSFKIKEIPSGMARRIQVFAKFADGTRKYVTGADTANNWYEKAQPIPVTTDTLEFVFVDKGLIRSVELPILIPPSYIKGGTVEITLTANQFHNAHESTFFRHHRRVERADGTFVEITQADLTDWTKLTKEQKALLEPEKQKKK
jgi:hypothetical protein